MADSPTANSTWLPAHRYRLRASPAPAARLQVFDLSLNAKLADWRGRIAERLLACDLLPGSLDTGGDCYGCKNLIQRLALLAASESLSHPSDADGATALKRLPGRDRQRCPLAERLRTLDHRLSSDEHAIASLLFSHRGEHLSIDDVACLLGLKNAPVTRQRVESALSELASLRVVQQLRVHGGPTFYDVDTRPHLHIYDRASNTLHDAEVHGIVEVESIATLLYETDASVTVLPGAANDNE